MTVLSTGKILLQPLKKLWKIAFHFARATRGIDGVERAKHISGEAA
jgi:hypothetical protein